MKAQIILLCCGLLTGPAAFGAAILILPTSQTVLPGSIAQVDVVVSGLGDLAPPSLSVYDLDLAYDDSILSLIGVNFGDPIFGMQLALLGVASIQMFGPGVGSSVNVFEASLNTESELHNLQSGLFRLFQAEFQAMAAGTSLLSITVHGFVDASETNPQQIPLTSIGSARIIVTPEPGTFVSAIVGLAMFGAGLVRRRQRVNAGGPAESEGG